MQSDICAGIIVVPIPMAWLIYSMCVILSSLFSSRQTFDMGGYHGCLNLELSLVGTRSKHLLQIYIHIIADYIWILLDSSEGIEATLLAALESQRYSY